MQKRHEVCKACKFAAPCYGLGLQLVLQMIVERGQWLGSTLPERCPQFRPAEWQVCDLNNELVVVPIHALKEQCV